MTDTISLPEAVRQTVRAAEPAYELLGAKDRVGVNYEPHGHTLTPGDWAALMDFFDAHARGTPTSRAFEQVPDRRRARGGDGRGDEEVKRGVVSRET